MSDESRLNFLQKMQGDLDSSDNVHGVIVIPCYALFFFFQ